MKRRSSAAPALTLILFLFIPAFLPALDAGLLLDQTLTLDASGAPVPEGLGYDAAAVPWLSTPLGPARLYAAAGLNVKYEYKAWAWAPELLRTELALALPGGRELKAGRIPWTDPLGFIAGGLFDGAAFSLPAGEGEWSAAAFYTGFLYKKAAKITMTAEEAAAYYEPLNYGDFSRTYFAPRRLLAALGWEHPGIAERLRLKTALIVQYDLRSADERLHTGYLAAKAALPLGKRFIASAGAAAQLSVEQGGNSIGSGGGGLGFGFACDLALACMLPTAIHDRVSLLGRFSSGALGSLFTPFTPLTTEPQGRVLRGKLSGLSMLEASWQARLHRDLSLSAWASYFVRGDLDTWKGRPSGDSGYFLGGECFAEALWSPASDIQFRAGGGIFFPALGNVAPGEAPFWRVELGLLMAVR